MNSFQWAEGYCTFEQVAFRRIFRPKRQPASPNASIVTAYTNGEVTLRSNRRTEGYHEAADLSGYQAVRAGDFVVHGLDILRGSIGVSDSDGAITSVCIVCEPRGEADPRYFAYVMRAQAWSGLPRALARGVREGGADFRRWDTLAALPLPRPEPPLQSAIADFLDRETGRIDALVEKKRRLIELLEEKRTALISHVVTKGLDPTVPMNDSGIPWIGTIPAHWDVMKLGHLGTLVSGVGFPDRFQGVQDAELPLYKVSDMNAPGNEKYMHRAANTVSRDVARVLGGRIVGNGAILFPKVGAAMLTNKRRILSTPSLFDNNLMALSLQLDHRAEYVHAVLSTLDFGLFAQQGPVPSISAGQVREVRVPLPPHGEQRAIAEQLSAQTRHMVGIGGRLHHQLALLAEYRQALITASVTGQIDVTAEAAEPEEVATG